MSTQNIAGIPEPSTKQLRFLKAIEVVGAAMLALKNEVSGPPVTADEDKQALVSAHQQSLQRMESAIADYTEAGMALTPAEQDEFHPLAKALVSPLLLESPFARRCIEKPLGYAGDYVMVRHILGEPFQGESAFAQLLNYALVQIDVAQGHRNRIDGLEGILTRYAAQGAEQGRKFSALTIGCGPAEETYRFIKNSPHADSLDLSLLDFNKETLDWTAGRLGQVCQETGRNPGLHYIEESVYNLAKQKPATVKSAFDLVICAGLFDYLSDSFCKRVIEYGARSLLPGGTLLVTNVSRSQSSFSMSKMLEWDLIYRSSEHLASLMPVNPKYAHKVYADSTGTNVMGELTLL